MAVNRLPVNNPAVIIRKAEVLSPDESLVVGNLKSCHQLDGKLGGKEESVSTGLSDGS